jgi:hypothetical protein
MTMTFHISEALLMERALFVGAMILIFGLISIGGLYLLRRRIEPVRGSAPAWQNASAVGRDEAEAFARVLVRLSGGKPEREEHGSQTQAQQETARSGRE